MTILYIILSKWLTMFCWSKTSSASLLDSNKEHAHKSKYQNNEVMSVHMHVLWQQGYNYVHNNMIIVTRVRNGS